MANITENVAQGGFSQILAGYFEDLQARRARNAIFRNTKRELENLSDRDLADLGINRSMIKSIASEAASKA